MAEALIDNLARDSEEMKFYLQEKLILEVTEVIAEFMQRKNVRKVELARRLNKSKGYITQVLNGRANMTLRTVADVMWAVDCSLSVTARPLGFEAYAESGGEYDFSSVEKFYSHPHIQTLQPQGDRVAGKKEETSYQYKWAI